MADKIVGQTSGPPVWSYNFCSTNKVSGQASEQYS